MYNDFSNQICRIENILDEHIERYTQPGYKPIVNLNQCLYVYSKSHSKNSHCERFRPIFNFALLVSVSRKTTIFENLIKSFEEAASDENLILSSRIIRDVLINLNRMNYVLPGICEKITRYLYENRSSVSGGVVARAMYTLYLIGYEPAENGPLLDVAQNTPLPSQQQPVRFEEFGAIIERDFEVMSGLSIVRGCLALAFYRALPMDLIEKVFNIDFVTRLEKEISVCHASVRPSQFLFSLPIPV